MKILVVGAAGATGRLVVSSAVSAGHDVVALTRAGDRLPASVRLNEVAGDARDADAIARAATGVDAIVSTLGIGGQRGPTTVMTEAPTAIIDGAKRAGIRRVVLLSAFGVGDSLAKASGVMRLLLGGGKTTFADKAAGEEILRESGLAWTLVYPVLLTNKPASGRFAAADLAAVSKVTGVPQISRADVAAFLVDAAANSQWIGKTAVLAPAKSVR